MMRRLIALLVLVAASTALVAAPASATPPPPTQPPSAYVQTATYGGCSDWYLQTTYPMSAADPQWVFTCWNDWAVDDSYYGTSQDWYYWKADWQTVILYEQAVWDSAGWYWDCTLYPYGYGACNA